MLKLLYTTINNFLLILNHINLIQQFFLIVLLLILFGYCVINAYTRLYLFKILKKIIILLFFSLILNTFLNNYFTICELSNTKKTLLFLSIGSVSALAGITCWVYRNHNMLYHDYKSTIEENSLQIKYKLINVYSTSFLEAKGGIKPEFYNVNIMPMHTLWAKCLGNIFQNIRQNKCSLSLKEWVAISYGFSSLNEYYIQYLKNLTYLLNYRSNHPEVFNCAYYYYSNPTLPKLVLNPLFYKQDMEAFRIAGLLDDLDLQLMSFGGPSNLYRNRKIFSGLILDAEERDLFFASFAGMTFEKYTKIESTTKYTFDMFPVNSENIINSSFNFVYPFLWVLEKTLGLPNPIPSELFMANVQGTLDRFYFHNFPSAFKITPQDLFDPYIFIDPANQSSSNKSKIEEYVCKSINYFKSICVKYIP